MSCPKTHNFNYFFIPHEYPESSRGLNLCEFIDTFDQSNVYFSTVKVCLFKVTITGVKTEDNLTMYLYISSRHYDIQTFFYKNRLF